MSKYWKALGRLFCKFRITTSCLFFRDIGISGYRDVIWDPLTLVSFHLATLTVKPEAHPQGYQDQRIPNDVLISWCPDILSFRDKVPQFLSWYWNFYNPISYFWGTSKRRHMYISTGVSLQRPPRLNEVEKFDFIKMVQFPRRDGRMGRAVPSTQNIGL